MVEVRGLAGRGGRVDGSGWLLRGGEDVGDPTRVGVEATRVGVEAKKGEVTTWVARGV